MGTAPNYMPFIQPVERHIARKVTLWGSLAVCLMNEPWQGHAAKHVLPQVNVDGIFWVD